MTNRQNGGRSSTVVLLALVLLGLAGVSLWLLASRDNDRPVKLSAASLATLQLLKAPAEVRFYRNPEGKAPGTAINAAAQRTSSLLRAFGDASNGKLSISELPISSDEEASKAINDGIKPFNIEKGDAAYLGVVIQSGDQKEILPTLPVQFPEAIEADIARAIDRLVRAKDLAEASAPREAIADSVLEQVKAAVPDYRNVSVEESSKKLRENMLSDLHKAGAEFDARLASIRADIQKAEAAGDQAKLGTLRKAITEAELAHAENLKRIVAKSTEQLKALPQLKAQ